MLLLFMEDIGYLVVTHPFLFFIFQHEFNIKVSFSFSMIISFELYTPTMGAGLLAYLFFYSMLICRYH